MTREEFYRTKAWKRVRKNIWLKQSCLCARCHRPVYIIDISEPIQEEKRLKGIVHHKEYLNDKNFMNDSIALNEENLEGLCIDCHNDEHFSTNVTRKDVMFNAEGDLISK